jgi:hypothetical protein
VEERAPPRDRGAAGVQIQDAWENEYVLPVLSGIMSIPISYKLEQHQSAIVTEDKGTRAFFVHFAMGGRAPSESGHMANPQHGRVPNCSLKKAPGTKKVH